MTAEEMLAIYINNVGDTLMHFNPNHDPKTGRFARNSSGTTKYSQREVGRFAGNKAREYDNTSEGQVLSNRFFDSYEHATTDAEYEQARTHAAEYVKKSAQYVLKSIIDKYGVDYAAEYAGVEKYTNEDDLIKQYVDWELYRNGVDDIHLAHFNPDHDPTNCQFAKSSLGSAFGDAELKAIDAGKRIMKKLGL